MLLTAFAMLLATSGCAGIESWREHLNSNDYVDGTKQFNDTWVSKAGLEGRGDRPRETDLDSWWTWFMSPKARDIHRNTGVDF